MMAKTEVANVKESAVAISDDDFFDLPSGMDDVTAEDLTLPRHTLLQGLSPQVNDRKDEYIEGAKMGMVLNTATNRVTPSQRLIMCAYQRRHIEWVPRDKPCPIKGLPQVTGGGLYRDYGTDASILSECVEHPKNASLWTPRGHELVITGTWYVMDPETYSFGFIAMGRTQFTSSKKLMAGIRDEKIRTTKGIRPAPLYYRAWDMSSRLRDYEGNEWFVWNHAPGPKLLEYENGREMLAMITEMVESVNREEVTVDVTVGEVDETPKGDNARM